MIEKHFHLNIRVIALADCNNFFASCERPIRRKLEGKSIVVLSNNDGSIIARSNEAKALGYKMGEGTLRLSIQGIENNWGEKQAPISFGH